MVGAVGFEPTASSPPEKRATKLRYAPNQDDDTESRKLAGRMETPPVQTEHRNRLPWVVLWLLFAYLIIGAVSASVAPNTKAKSFTEELESIIKPLMKSAEMAGDLQYAGYAQATISTQDYDKARKSAMGLIAKVEAKESIPEDGRRSDGLARLDFLTSFALRLKPTSWSVERSKKGENLTEFLELQDANSPEEMKAIEPKLDKEGHLSRLTRALILERTGSTDAYKAFSNPEKKSAMLAVMALVLFGCLGGVGLWILYAVVRSTGKWQPLGPPSGQFSNVDADANAQRFVYFLLLQIGGAVLIKTQLQIILPSRVAALSTYILMIALMFWIASCRIGKSVMPINRVFGPDGFKPRHILWGLGAFIASIPALLLVMLAVLPFMGYLPTPSHPLNDIVETANDSLTWISIFFAACILAPIVEEIAFRGLLTPALSRVCNGVARGIVLNGFLFASIHPQGPLLWLALGWVGVMSAMLTFQTRSLYPSIIMHALHNCAILIVGIVTQR